MDGATEAADVLRELLTADADSTRLAAAREILKQATALQEASELEQRISRLEEEDDGMEQCRRRLAEWYERRRSGSP